MDVWAECRTRCRSSVKTLINLRIPVQLTVTARQMPGFPKRGNGPPESSEKDPTLSVSN